MADIAQDEALFVMASFPEVALEGIAAVAANPLANERRVGEIRRFVD